MAMTYDGTMSSGYYIVSTEDFSLRRMQLLYGVFNNIVEFSRLIHEDYCLARVFRARLLFNKDVNNRNSI